MSPRYKWHVVLMLCWIARQSSRGFAARRALGVLAAAAVLPAQEIKVWSEFQRIDPFGSVVAVDRVEHPREILSPAVARNAWASFQLAINIPEREATYLYVQQNPERFKVTVYREEFTQTPRGWIPDHLTEVNVPCLVRLPDEMHPVARQNTVVYWLDIWVPAATPPERMRMQAVLKVQERWIVYPMEVRVQPAVVPGITAVSRLLPPLTARSDASTVPGGTERVEAPSIRQMIRRNAVQDRALAGAMQVAPPIPPRELGAEGYLKIRDFLLQARPPTQ